MERLDRDFWVGLVFLAVSALYWFESGKIRISPLDGPVNASGLPKALAWALGSLALLLMIRSLAILVAGLRRPPTGSGGASVKEMLRPHLRAVGMLAIGVGYLLTVSWLGYAATIAALILVVSIYIGALPNLVTVAVAAGGGVLFHLLFVEFLGIPLPAGILGPILG